MHANPVHRRGCGECPGRNSFPEQEGSIGSEQASTQQTRKPSLTKQARTEERVAVVSKDLGGLEGKKIEEVQIEREGAVRSAMNFCVLKTG